MRNILLYLLLLSASVPCFGQSAKDEAKMADQLKQFFSTYKVKDMRLPRQYRMLSYQVDNDEKTINGSSTAAQKQEAGRQAADITRLCKKYGAAAFYWMGIVDRNDRSQSTFKWSMEQVADSIIANAK